MSNPEVVRAYDRQALAYEGFREDRFSWLYIEQPAYDRYIPDLYRPDLKVLELGCGNGLVARHLVSKGVLPENITGVDPSQEQLKKARELTPGIQLIHASAEDFESEDGIFDLVITNTVLHHLDNRQLAQMLSKVYRALKERGTYFFVEVDPDHSEVGRDPSNEDKWTPVRTPWGGEVPFYNRNPSELLNLLDRHGFDKKAGWTLEVSEAGKIDPTQFAYYSGRPSRMAARFEKVPYLEMIPRYYDVRIPDLVLSVEQLQQVKTVETYFQAWQVRSGKAIPEIFDEDATYDEKPGQEDPIIGIDKIMEYWEQNPMAQTNLKLNHNVIGFSWVGDSVWSEFSAQFDNRGKHYKVHGVIGFTINPKSKKISKLIEFFDVEKDQLVKE